MQVLCGGRDGHSDGRGGKSGDNDGHGQNRKRKTAGEEEEQTDSIMLSFA